VPKVIRAADAIKANQEKSDRAIAAGIGVGTMTVSRARNKTAPDGAVEKRVGLDGKRRRPPAPKVEIETIRNGMIVQAAAAIELAEAIFLPLAGESSENHHEQEQQHSRQRQLAHCSDPDGSGCAMQDQHFDV
jgi:hypothetical protein